MDTNSPEEHSPEEHSPEEHSQEEHSQEEQKPRWSIRKIAWLCIGIGLASYLVVIPYADLLINKFREQPSIIHVEDLTVAEIFRIRTAKFIVFFIFTYYGACLASFLNVVASSVPTGTSFLTRASACPQCGGTIRRIDNLPIFSYINLGGRCRMCLSAIPARYFLVELIGATIFGSLFLFELVTGAANVPYFKEYFYKGILWIILYTKWPVVGIYLYHCAFFCCLMILSLMECDRYRCPRWFAGCILMSFAALSLAVPTLQPVKFYVHVNEELANVLPPVAISLTTSLVGGLVGGLLTGALQFVGRHAQLIRTSGVFQLCGNAFPLAGTLIGIVLGWQATLTILVVTSVVAIACFVIKQQTRIQQRFSETLILSTVTFLHHPFWKWLQGFW